MDSLNLPQQMNTDKLHKDALQHNIGSHLELFYQSVIQKMPSFLKLWSQIEENTHGGSLLCCWSSGGRTTWPTMSPVTEVCVFEYQSKQNVFLSENGSQLDAGAPSSAECLLKRRPFYTVLLVLNHFSSFRGNPTMTWTCVTPAGCFIFIYLL